MPLMPTEPMRYFEGARREMERLFGSSFSREEPRIDLYEKEREIIASCEIPGLQGKEDIRIQIGESTLSIGGTIKREREIKDENMLRQERYRGNFRRSISLPAPVIAGESQAIYRNGILEITMPKSEPHQQKKDIEIEFH